LGRKARGAFGRDWVRYAERRDFTINGLSVDADGIVHDHVGGLIDIKARRVRFIGDAGQRIAEDHLRILRFFRFHAQYGAGSPDRKGFAAAVARKADLRDLSPERIRQELFKLLTGRRAVETVRLMAKRSILGEILKPRDDLRALGRMARIDAAQGLAPDPLLRLLLLSAVPTSLRETLRLSNAESERVVSMTHAAPVSPSLRPEERAIMLYQLGADTWCDQVRLAWAETGASSANGEWRALLDLAQGWERPRFPISGDDLIARGFASGPALGAALSFLEDWWVASGFKPSRDELLKQLAKLGN
jgi:poly(A) polymerase